MKFLKTLFSLLAFGSVLTAAEQGPFVGTTPVVSRASFNTNNSTMLVSSTNAGIAAAKQQLIASNGNWMLRVSGTASGATLSGSTMFPSVTAGFALYLDPDGNTLAASSATSADLTALHGSIQTSLANAVVTNGANTAAILNLQGGTNGLNSAVIANSTSIVNANTTNANQTANITTVSNQLWTLSNLTFFVRLANNLLDSSILSNTPTLLATGSNGGFTLGSGNGRFVAYDVAATTNFSFGPANNTNAFTMDAGGNVSIKGTASIGTLSVTNITGLTTNSLTVVSTNFISGQLYTNNTGVAIIVSANAAIHVAAVLGEASLSIQCRATPTTGGATNISGISSLITSISMDYTNVLSIVVPTNAVYCFTNLSSGSGNTATVVGGQITYIVQQVIAPVATYKVYRALLTQSGTDAPVATIYENSLSSTIIYTYIGTGLYRGTLASAFPAGKFFGQKFNFQADDGSNAAITIVRETDNSITLTCLDSGGSATEMNVTDLPMTWLVYP